MQSIRASNARYDICRVGTNRYQFWVHGDFHEIAPAGIEDDIQYECRSFLSDVYSLSDQEVIAWIETNHEMLYTKMCAIEDGELAQKSLDESDYKVIKCMEGGLDIEAEYPGLIAQRNEWREQVNVMKAYGGRK
jgi:hypothetical protein